MPIQECSRNGETGFKAWEDGTCYLPSEEGSEDAARQKALKQEQAIQIQKDKPEVTATHEDMQETQADTTDVYEDEPGEESQAPSEPDTQKYIKVQFHPPAYFSGYRTKPYRLTSFYDEKRDGESTGILVSLGIWRKTGAQAIQKFLFEKTAGWTLDGVQQWFLDHPHYPMPSMTATGIFVAMADDAPEQIEQVDYVEALQQFPAFDSAAVFDVILIRAGWGKNRRRGPDGQLYRDYFTSDFLQQLLPMTEGSAVQSIKLRAPGTATDTPSLVRALVAELQQHGHPPEAVNQLFPLGLSGNTIGFLRHVRVTESPDPLQTGTVIRAAFCLADTPDAMNARQLWQSARSYGLSRALGLSINYKSSAIFTQVEGQLACVFTVPTQYVSCEFVANPAAGGMILSPMQENTTEKREGEHRMKDDIQKNGQTQGMPAAPETDGNAEQSATPAQAAPGVATPQVDVSALQSSLDGLQEKLEKSLAQNELLAQLAQSNSDAVAAMQEIRAKEDLTSLVVGSDVTPTAKTQILTKIATGEAKSRDQVESLLSIALSAAEDARPKDAPIFPGLHLSRGIQIKAQPQDLLKIRSLKMWGIPLTQAEQELDNEYHIEQFWGLQQEYKTLTGDDNLNFTGLKPQTFLERCHPDLVTHRGHVDDVSATQAMLTTTYSDFLTHVLDRTLQVHFDKQNKDHLRVCRRGEPYSDNIDQTHFVIGQYGDIAAVAENGTYQEVSYGGLERVTSSSAKYGNIFSVTEESVQDDRLDFIKESTKQLATSANRTVYGNVMKKVIGYSTAWNDEVQTDSIAGVLYSATRRNLIDGSIDDFDKLKQLINLMLTAQDLLDDGGTRAAMTIEPYLFIGEVTKIGAVMARMTSKLEPGRSDSLPNTMFMPGLNESNFIKVHPNYLYEHPEALIIMPNPQEFAGLVLSFFKGMESPQLVWAGNQQPAYGNAFSNDRLELKIKFKYRLYRERPAAFYAMYQA